MLVSGLVKNMCNSVLKTKNASFASGVSAWGEAEITREETLSGNRNVEG